FIPDLGAVSTISSAETVTVPNYSEHNIVDGTSGDNSMLGSFVDSDGEGIDDTASNEDLVYGYAGNDTIDAGAGADSVFGGSGADSILGGSGDDELYGDTPGSTQESLNWFAEGTDGNNLSNFTQNTGEMDVSVSFNVDGDNATRFRVETSDEIYTESGEPFDDHSSLYLWGRGDGDTSTTSIDFAAASNADVQDEVENVVFRINDIDFGSGNHLDIVTINATNAAGDPVDVDITIAFTGSNADTVSGNTITAGARGDGAGDQTGSALIEIDGPVENIEIVYANGLSGTQAIWVSDIYFDTIPNDDGNDTIDGGSGSDVLMGMGGDDLLIGGEDADKMDGGTGDDELRVGEGDQAMGGDGDDTFVLVDTGDAGASNITIIGGEGDEDGVGDTLDLNGIGDRSTLNLTTDTAGEKAGTVELLDGSVVTFSNIERIICFTPGTLIETAYGPRPVETLRLGDLIVTRDSGLQPLRWIGKKTVEAKGNLAPIELSPTILQDAKAPLLVSPQHRILWSGPRAQLLFGDREVLVAAAHLLDNPAVRRREGGDVTYLHLMLDQHEVIYANGAATESFFPGDEALSALNPEGRDEMFDLFPELRSHLGAFGDTARMCLKRHEARLLSA
ncbi:MAG: Hint domain-containing protein, partial [Rhodobacteraceae bacterium]|nr:Hint domain-containing protein [Paracoccaceae bacterium]